MRLHKPVTALVFFALALPAAAADRGWYAGISAGQSRTDDELVSNRESTITNASDIRSTFDDKDNAWKAFGGYRFSDVIAVEILYADLGSHKTSTTFTTTSNGAAGGVDVQRKVKGYGADLVLTAPLGQQFAVFGRAGAFRSKLDATATLTGSVSFTNGSSDDRTRTATGNETTVHWGAGGEWRFHPQLALRVEWERFSNIGKKFEIGASGTTGEANTDMISAGIAWRF